MEDKRSVMILDGTSQAALAITRNFGSRGIKVFVGGHARLAQSFFSKYCSGSFLYPVDDTCERMHEVILAQVKRFRPDVLMPLFDRSFSVVLEHQEQYRQYTRLIPLPEIATFKKFEDKQSLLLWARRNNIPVPKTFCPVDRVALRECAQEMNFPVIVKPRLSWGGIGIVRAASVSELYKIYDTLFNSRKKTCYAPEIFFDNERPLIQEYIEGDVFNFYGYFEDAALKTFFTTQTVRNYPLLFGHSIAAHSIKNNAIRDLSLSLMKQARWNGVVSIQYMYDQRDKAYKLIDVNPRLWSTIEMAIISGVNFPEMLFRKAMDEPMDYVSDFREGRQFRWILWDELFYFLKCRNKFTTLREYLRFDNMSCEVSLIDFKPHLIRSIGLLKQLFSKRI